jgi:hypothetical protein
MRRATWAGEEGDVGGILEGWSSSRSAANRPARAILLTQWVPPGVRQLSWEGSAAIICTFEVAAPVDRFLVKELLA